MNNIIQLDPSQIMLAATAGIQRQVEAIKRGIPHAYGTSNSNCWHVDIEGALAEYALSLFLDVSWNGQGKYYGAPDIGNVAGVDVRSTQHENGRLIIHEANDDNRVFWLLTGFRGLYVVRGWIWGWEGKSQQYWTDPTGKNRAAYFVPQSALRPPLCPTQ
jgi:hypothetical protein